MSDYAPLYSTRERVRLALLLAAIFVPLLLISHFWLLPWLEHFARYANCFEYRGIDGVRLLFYGVFVGIPLSSALLVILLFGRRSVRILRAGQDPLPGEKVLRKTRYRYGVKALITPLAVVAFVIVFVGMAIWGSAQADKMVREPLPCSEQQRLELGREAG